MWKKRRHWGWNKDVIGSVYIEGRESGWAWPGWLVIILCGLFIVFSVLLFVSFLYSFHSCILFRLPSFIDIILSAYSCFASFCLPLLPIFLISVLYLCFFRCSGSCFPWFLTSPFLVRFLYSMCLNLHCLLHFHIKFFPIVLNYFLTIRVMGLGWCLFVTH